jgi:hypothetical protein
MRKKPQLQIPRRYQSISKSQLGLIPAVGRLRQEDCELETSLGTKTKQN